MSKGITYSLLFLLSCAVIANAERYYWVKVTSVRIYDSGTAYVKLQANSGSSMNPGNCTDATWKRISSDDISIFALMLSLATVAYKEKRYVTVDIDGCLGNNPKLKMLELTENTY